MRDGLAEKPGTDGSTVENGLLLCLGPSLFSDADARQMNHSIDPREVVDGPSTRVPVQVAGHPIPSPKPYSFVTDLFKRGDER
jgi:hypothetical protein